MVLVHESDFNRRKIREFFEFSGEMGGTLIYYDRHLWWRQNFRNWGSK
jgi:hypothetical protein